MTHSKHIHIVDVKEKPEILVMPPQYDLAGLYTERILKLNNMPDSFFELLFLMETRESFFFIT